MTDLHCSFGPVSTLPGHSTTDVPIGIVCDTHQDVLATHRVQGETDSFGCEYTFMCAACFSQHRIFEAARQEEERPCDWCRSVVKGVRPYRDADEGSAGPVYQVCTACRKLDLQRYAEELPYDYGNIGW